MNEGILVRNGRQTVLEALPYVDKFVDGGAGVHRGVGALLDCACLPTTATICVWQGMHELLYYVQESVRIMSFV